MTWPLAIEAGDHVLRAAYYWDAYTNAMIMGCRVDALLGRAPLSLYDNYFFAPLSSSIVFNENHFGLSLLFAPFYLVSNNPLWAYNLTLLSSMALSVFFTYRLVRRLTGNDLAGMLAGVAFSFCPYIMFELGRIQLIATQWIPACFLFLHRAIEDKRPRDVVWLWLSYVLQVGTCLYYAMFLIPLLGLAAAVLLVRERPPRSLYLWLAAGGVAAGAIALGMVYPYFSARSGFDLERSLAFASSYDGKLSFFGNVHETNRTLTSMHHQAPQRGAHEEIAFPGFTVLTMLVVGLAVPLRRLIEGQARGQWIPLLARWGVCLSVAFAATLVTHSMLAGGVVVLAGAWLERRRGAWFPFAGRQGLYLALLLLAVLMFLGLSPWSYAGSPVRGLYYYFHTYFPGFNGIRKVSRQAVMTSFAFCVLSSYGSAWLLSGLKRRREQALAFLVLLGAICFELRNFPHPLVREWAGDTVPKAYRFMASSLPDSDTVAVMPQNDGVRHFWGDRGMALHNYLALYHRHRFVNGQSSWQPPVTELARRALINLPDAAAWRVLAAIGTRHLLVHAEDLPPARRSLPEQLAAQAQHFQRVFRDGDQHVFTLVGLDDPTLTLLRVPKLPSSAKLVDRRLLQASSQFNPQAVARAVDGDLDTVWTTRRWQAQGQAFELALRQPVPVVAFEIENPASVMQVPMSYELSVSLAGGAFRTVSERPVLRLFAEQIHEPKNFVFRIVLDEPVLADRVRIAIRQPVPGHALSIHEARLYQRH